MISSFICYQLDININQIEDKRTSLSTLIASTEEAGTDPKITGIQQKAATQDFSSNSSESETSVIPKLRFLSMAIHFSFELLTRIIKSIPKEIICESSHRVQLLKQKYPTRNYTHFSTKPTNSYTEVIPN